MQSGGYQSVPLYLPAAFVPVDTRELAYVKTGKRLKHSNDDRPYTIWAPIVRRVRWAGIRREPCPVHR